MTSTELEYGLSTRAVFRRLGLELNELRGWNCCGASSTHALNHTLALALPARTLALAQAASVWRSGCPRRGHGGAGT